MAALLDRRAEKSIPPPATEFVAGQDATTALLLNNDEKSKLAPAPASGALLAGATVCGTRRCCGCFKFLHYIAKINSPSLIPHCANVLLPSSLFSAPLLLLGVCICWCKWPFVRTTSLLPSSHNNAMANMMNRCMDVDESLDWLIIGSIAEFVIWWILEWFGRANDFVWWCWRCMVAIVWRL